MIRSKIKDMIKFYKSFTQSDRKAQNNANVMTRFIDLAHLTLVIFVFSKFILTDNENSES